METSIYGLLTLGKAIQKPAICLGLWTAVGPWALPILQGELSGISGAAWRSAGVELEFVFGLWLRYQDQII